MSIDLKGQAAVVTGASKGIGYAVAEALAAAGANVVVCARNEEEVRGAAERLSSKGGGRVRAVRCDMRSYDDVRALIEVAVQEFGGVDVLVNNASVFPAARIDAVDEALWDETLAVNLKAPFFLTQRLGSAMRRRGEGVVVNIGDLAGLQVWEGYAVHSISKAAMVQLTRVAALSQKDAA